MVGCFSCHIRLSEVCWFVCTCRSSEIVCENNAMVDLQSNKSVEPNDVKSYVSRGNVVV
eukprot:m.35228 g.35228  ORF g.35228 m.35228 type:complete len:59 (+) comp8860_c0_seq1:2295-2471(+)